MKTLHFYLMREVLATLLMTVAVFTFVLMLGNVLKEVLALLVNRQASLWSVVQAIGLLVPFVMVFALPMGMLTATLLVFGRFSADHELTAVRASGVSLVALITPILLLSVLLSGISAIINMEVAPQCRVAYKRLLAAVGMAKVGALFPEGTFIKDFKGKIIYVGKIDGAQLRDILMYDLDQLGNVESYVRAADGRVQVDRTNNVVTVQLFDAWRVGVVEGRRTPVPLYAEESQFTYTNTSPAEVGEKVRLTDMAFHQLWNQLHELEKRVVADAPLRQVPVEQLAEYRRALDQQRIDVTLPVMIQIHRQVSFSFACIGFTLVGIPLGIRAHRRETTFGIAVALILVLLYYSFFILGQALDTRPEFAPHLILWLPNFVFQAVGGVLLWRANRGV
jgi:lipopolysaccharide export system permease protein